MNSSMRDGSDPEPRTPLRQRALVVALVGAESTGKSTLARALHAALTAQGRHVALVDESLRAFCDLQQRTPRQDEQLAIARLQSERIEAATQDHEIVVADTTALMTAVYSELVFGDASLYDEALEMQQRCDLTLLTALDLPWVADGLQRDGAQVREPVDALLRAALLRAGIGHAIVAGQGERRSAAALAAVDRAWKLHSAGGVDQRARWQWVCERCGDAGCERHGLRDRLLAGSRAAP